VYFLCTISHEIIFKYDDVYHSYHKNKKRIRVFFAVAAAYAPYATAALRAHYHCDAASVNALFIRWSTLLSESGIRTFTAVKLARVMD